jgi:hypothetical protein
MGAHGRDHGAVDAQRADRVRVIGVEHLLRGERLGQPEEQMRGVVHHDIDPSPLVDHLARRVLGRSLQENVEVVKVTYEAFAVDGLTG